jgi:hypothetical protein
MVRLAQTPLLYAKNSRQKRYGSSFGAAIYLLGRQAGFTWPAEVKISMLILNYVVNRYR